MSLNLIEICRRVLFSNVLKEEPASWSNEMLSIFTEEGIEMFQLECSVASGSNELSFSRTLIKPFSHWPSQYIDKLDDIVKNLPVQNLNDCLLSPVIAPNIHGYQQVSQYITSIKFSPTDLILNNKTVAAVKTNVGGVYFLFKTDYEWMMLHDISKAIYKFYENIWKINGDLDSKSYECLYRKCKDLETCSIVWSHMDVNMDKQACYFFTAQSNNSIFIWRVKRINDIEISVDFVSKFISDSECPVSLHHIPVSDNLHLVIVGGSCGRIAVYKIFLKNNKFILKDSLVLWSQIDKMVMCNFLNFTIGNNIVMWFVKSCYIIIILFNPSTFKIQTTKVENILLKKIVSCTKLKNNDIVCVTLEGHLHIASIQISDKVQIVFSCHLVNINIDLQCFSVCGVGLSENEAVWALTCRRSVALPTKYKYKSFVVFAQLDGFDYMAKIFNNPSEKLTQYWDCIELCRHNILKQKKLPNMDFSQIFTGPDMNTYLLKVYMCFSNIYNNLISSKGITTMIQNIFALPENRVVDTIFARHSVTLVDELFRIYQCNNSKLSILEIKMFEGCYNYLLHFSETYQFDMVNLLNPQIDVMVHALSINKFPKCEFCCEPVKGFKCSNNHHRQFCVVTFQTMGSEDYLLCPNCKAVASFELYSTKPQCTLCDTHLERSFKYCESVPNKSDS